WPKRSPMVTVGPPATCSTPGAGGGLGGGGVLEPPILAVPVFAVAVELSASLTVTGPLVGVIESLSGDVVLVLVELSVNFCWKTSVISFCTSGDSGVVVWLMMPLLMLIC